MQLLVLNSGSSSVKFELFDVIDGEPVSVRSGVREEVDDYGDALASIFDDLAGSVDDLAAIGHRVVHGGDRFSAPTLVDDQVLAELAELSPLAPLHNPPALDGIRHAMELRPGTPNVAVFDTAFHQTMEPVAYRYAVPGEWYRRHGVRRFGFHGTSHRYVANAAAERLGRPLDELRLITAHLGNGASLAAIDHGRVIDTSMGMSPLEGLVMGTRPGDLDVGVVFHMWRAGMEPSEVELALNRRSGLLGVGGASDMRELHLLADSGDTDAELAIDMFCYRIRGYLGAYLAHLGGCDAVVFTGGIGEHDADVRHRIIEPLAHLDFGEFFVIPTDEERMIALDTLTLV